MKLRCVLTVAALALMVASPSHATFDLSLLESVNSGDTATVEIKTTALDVEMVGAFQFDLSFTDLGAGSVGYSVIPAAGYLSSFPFAGDSPDGTASDGNTISVGFFGGPIDFTSVGQMETLATIMLSDIQLSETPFNVNLTGGIVGSNFANVVGGTTTVPEPSAFLLMGLVGLGWIGVKRFYKSKK